MVERAAEIGFLLLVVAGIPAMSWLTATDPQLRTLPRTSLYLSAAASEWLFVALGMAAARVGRFGVGELGFRTISLKMLGTWALLILGLTAAGLGVQFLLERWGWWPEEAELIYLLMPQTRAEKIWALALVAPTAALTEEFLYRGYLFAVIGRAFGSIAAAWALSSIAFGLAHSYQRPSGMVRAGLLGALLAWPVVRTGSLYPAIAAHFLIDAAMFAWLGPRMLKAGKDWGSA